MKRRLLCVTLAASLVLSIVMPTTALAAKGGIGDGFESFYAAGEITGITPGDVSPAGNSGRWLVSERSVAGNLAGSVNADFVMTFKANVAMATQAGNLHGTLVIADEGLTLAVRGKIQPLEVVEVAPGIYLPKLTITGSWTLAQGAQGNGTFTGWAIFIPTPEGHVDVITASFFDMTGKWKPVP